MAAPIRSPCKRISNSLFSSIFSRDNTYCIHRLQPVNKLLFNSFSNETIDSSSHLNGRVELLDHFRRLRSGEGIPIRKDKKWKQKDKILQAAVNFRVVSTGNYASGKSVILHIDDVAYLFNAGDDITRLLQENGGKWSNLEHVFITHKSYQNVAGTLDVNASMMALLNPKLVLNIHGPSGVDCLVSVEKYKRTFAMDFDSIINRHPPGQIYTDHALTVKPIHFHSTKYSEKETSACAYKLEIKPPMRRVNTDNLVRLCVKPGPWLHEVIEKNETIEVNGKAISPDDILEPPPNTNVLLVIECPNMKYFPDMLRKSEQLTRKSDSGKFVDGVIHLTPDEVVSHEKYQQWMSHFPLSTKHFMIPESKSCASLKTAWRQQVNLHEFDKNIFPLPYPRPIEGCDEAVEQQEDDSTNIITLQPGSKYTVQPLAGLNNLDVCKATRATIPNYDLLKEELRNPVSMTDESETREYPVVTMLGTGASLSSKTRNLSGILVETDKDKYILLDCGFGMVGQLQRLYGHEKVEEILRNLRAVFVSHGHIDHHGGLLGLVSARKRAFRGGQMPKLYFTFPQKLLSWYIHVNAEFSQCLTNVRLISHTFFENAEDSLLYRSRAPSKSLSPAEVEELNSNLGLDNICTFRVQHAYAWSCCGIRLEHKDWKMVYTGDTMPCKEVVEAAKGVDLLIHEATFGQQFEKDAELKTHSTVHQAMDIAKEAGAKFTLLTHFSARYAYFPAYSQRLLYERNVGVACDNMVLRPKDLPNVTARALYPIFKAMYPDHIDYFNDVIKAELATCRKSGMEPQDIVRKLNELSLKEQNFWQTIEKHVADTCRT